MIKTHELLRLLLSAKGNKALLEQRYGQRGIAVRTDSAARRWQRRDRQARKLKLWLQERLGYQHYYLIDTETGLQRVYNDPEFCGRCGLGTCRCGDKGWPHIPQTPAMLIKELLLEADLDDTLEAFHFLLDGHCKVCGKETNIGHELCSDCARSEYQNWRDYIGDDY